jgi:prepilin-type N-terminal cleavage/methylation domain-containing protein
MKPQKEGFSLIELLVCIGIVSLLITISLPSMTSLTGRQRVAAQIVEIRNTLQPARSLAVMEGEIWKVCMLDTQQNCVKQNGDTLTVFRDDNNDNQRGHDEKRKNVSSSPEKTKCGIGVDADPKNVASDPLLPQVGQVRELYSYLLID